MKRIAALFCVIALLIAIIPTATADIGTYYVKTANRGTLNMRQSPSSSAQVMTKLNYGTSVWVVLFNNGWAYIKANNQYGWVVSNYLSSTNPNKSDNTSAPDYDHVTLKNSIFNNFHTTYYRAIVNPTRRTGFVNLRWAPSTNAKPMDIRYYGYELTVLQENGTWCQVYDQEAGICGFMMKEYLLPTGYGIGQ